MKKGDDVTVDDEVRTSVTQNRVTATLSTEELFLRTRYLRLCTYCIRQVKKGGRVKGPDSQHNTRISPS